jgi:hypothetical protein
VKQFFITFQGLPFQVFLLNKLDLFNVLKNALKRVFLQWHAIYTKSHENWKFSVYNIVLDLNRNLMDRSMQLPN